ncbi:LysR family transcriptional regulator [Pseudomonas sp. S8]|uniref:LysR family transcriptional regulator n=1 Tax=Pseudomonas sp. S8 TaxID=211136 RepID=UPI003D27F669
MLSTRQLRYFVEIADCGSFSAAAERLFVAQSALSRQIKDMESRLQRRCSNARASAKTHGGRRGFFAAGQKPAQ